MIWIATVLALLTLIAIGWSLTDGSRGWVTNHARLDRDASHPELRPRHFPASPRQVADAIERFVDGSPRWKRVGRVDDAPEIRFVLERTTRLFRFVDDVTLQLSPEGAGTLVTGDSRSRVGKGDLGQNARNLREILRATEHRLDRTATTQP